MSVNNTWDINNCFHVSYAKFLFHFVTCDILEIKVEVFEDPLESEIHQNQCMLLLVLLRPSNLNYSKIQLKVLYIIIHAVYTKV